MLIKRVYNRFKYELFHLKFLYSKRRRRKFDVDDTIESIKKNYPTLNLAHKYFHHYFWNRAPQWLKIHRAYFGKDNRAFGEDAFHAMWYLIFKEFKPKKVLEIGIYRGSTLSLFSLLSQKFSLDSEVHGISPFSPAGDLVSKYLEGLDYLSDVIMNYEYLNLPLPQLHKGYSTDQEMINIIKSKTWDLIFIDGNHDYEVAKHDFDICSENITQGGLIVLDDASLYTEYNPPFYSTAGHPGPSKVAAEIDLNVFREILSVGHNRVFQKK